MPQDSSAAIAETGFSRSGTDTRTRALLIALAIHLLVLLAVKLTPAPARAPATTPPVTTVQLLPKPKPKIKPLPLPKTAGVKLSRRPSVGVPSAKTIEHKLTTLPMLTFESEIARPAVVDPLPELGAINVASTVVGTGGTGSSGAGAGASGQGSGGQGNSTRLFAECESSPDRPMVAAVFRVPSGTEALPPMNRQRTIKTICMAQLNVTPRAFTQGFPGLDMTEWFGLDIRFTVNVPEAGAVDLMLTSDDGAILYVDNVELIDNDGKHAAEEKIGHITLSKGLHDFRVRYFQGPRTQLALMLGWKRPADSEFRYIPRQLLGRPRVAAQ